MSEEIIIPDNHEEIKDDFRMIISHALLGCDTDDIDRETWELLLEECAKYVELHLKFSNQ